MKKNIRLKSYKFIRWALLALAAVFVFMTLPFGAFALRSARAETKPQKLDDGVLGRAAALENVTLTVNYYRTDGVYKDWDLWVWAIGANGSGVKLNREMVGEKIWATAEIVFESITPDDSNRIIGVIPRKGGDSWTEQTGNIYITADMVVDNAVTIYLVDKDETIYESSEDALANKFTSAGFKTFDSVLIETSQIITASSVIKIKDTSGTVYKTFDCSKDSALVGKRVATLVLDSDFELDFSKTYIICDEPADGFDMEINFSQNTINKYKLYDNAEFAQKFHYDGALGAEYSKEKTVFTVWSPAASAISVKIYDAGEGGEAVQTVAMARGGKGEWKTDIVGDLNGKYYTYAVTMDGSVVEVVDPYARSAGRDGKRGMILDLAATNPDGWANQANPTLDSYSNAVIYEAQLRDLTIHESSGVTKANRGKFLGLTETGTKNSHGQSTALDYIKELGVTEVHFQPLFDFASVSESFNEATYDKAGEYNWGYDPLNYNVPEGSYSSDPADGAKRVNEMKQMVMALHNAGIQVVMDVVYNHVSNAQTSNFEALMPGYYFRTTDDGSFYNGSGCGNETASNRYMFGRFMIDSVKYWTEEYKIDGFRFDLMALHDIDTMNALYDELAAINPDVIVYGEGWDAGSNGLDSSKQANQANAAQMPNIAVFNDVIRDGLKGSVFTAADTGYVSGKPSTETVIYVGATGSTSALPSKYRKQLGASAFASNPTQSINYVSCHDNTVLWDKLNVSVNADKETLKAMDRLAIASVLTSQGPAFFLAGDEMLRSKPTTETNDFDNRPNAYLTDPTYFFSDNSYKSPDSVNAINWNWLNENADMVEFYKQLIAIKKTFPQFQLTTTEQVKRCVTISDDNILDRVAAYVVKDPQSDNYAVVIFNANDSAMSVAVPNGSYNVHVNGSKANASDALSAFTGSEFTVGARSCVIMVGTPSADSVKNWSATASAFQEKSGNGLALGLGIGIPAAVLVAGGAVFGVMFAKKKKNGKTSDDNEGKDDKDGDKPESKPEAENAETPTQAVADAGEPKSEEGAGTDGE